MHNNNEQYQQSLKVQQLQQQSSTQESLQLLYNMGFIKSGKNKGLLAKFHGDHQQVLNYYLEKQDKKCYSQQRKFEKNQANQLNQSLKELPFTDLLIRTKLLIIDCNNVMYADHEIMKKNNYNMSPKKIINQIFKVILLWTNTNESQIQEVRMIWDRINYKTIIEPQHKQLYQDRQLSSNCLFNLDKLRKQMEDLHSSFHQSIRTSLDQQVRFTFNSTNDSKITVLFKSLYNQDPGVECDSMVLIS